MHSLLAQRVVSVFQRTLADHGGEPYAQGGRIPETCFLRNCRNGLVRCFQKKLAAGDAAGKQIGMGRRADDPFEHLQEIGTGKVGKLQQLIQVQLITVVQADVIGSFQDQPDGAGALRLFFHQVRCHHGQQLMDFQGICQD